MDAEGTVNVHGGRQPSATRSGPAERPDDARRPRFLALAGLAATTGYLWARDPSEAGVWPPCPSRALLGIDCPGCGGLRGTHDLLHGDVLGALDHNLLLPLIGALIALMLALWMLPLVGRPARRLDVPPWAAVAAGVVIAVFTVLRNLPVPALASLGSG
jgi:Protein of unknown function (DUF2752)